MKLRECHHSEVEQEDEERKNIAQQILKKSTNFQGADHRASRKTGKGGHTVVRMPLMSLVPAGDWSTATSFREKAAVQLVMYRMCRPAGLEKYEKNLGHQRVTRVALKQKS